MHATSFKSADTAFFVLSLSLFSFFNIESFPDQQFFISTMSFDFDLTAPFQTAFTTRDQHEHRHKVRPVQVGFLSDYCSIPVRLL
ncbi:hypothetical protein B9Z55_012300 [Caenorhabditis nigoni]|uniref:Secreted protein n=1 Tax=Caenorhabditis nigoni TaxID=1611254 RepID=A0A2G5TXK3_9PELO|nr:hypothetical protein B9Z55_012300 [Caenorhabditis nigoni]